ncbi:MAG: 6-carboxytetrahydropterin synthase QueD [Treponema sp.]|nr:6-carboxytetrahydropterin synthase QueD [Treponema sp.]
MYEVRVTADFAAAHFLRDYHGKCENLHGHNYKVYAHVAGSELDAGGMLLDFSVLKSALKKVCALLDHTNLNDNPYFDQNPSAERIARFIYEKLVEELPELKKAGAATENAGATLNAGGAASDKGVAAFLKAVDVFETETSRARFTVVPC